MSANTEKLSRSKPASLWNQPRRKARENSRRESKMAAISGNQTNKANLSMAAELFSLITDEEYTSDVQSFSGTGYLNKTDVGSIKKMVSGKLWIDSRKFVSRQNCIVINGMFAMFGLKMGKSASDIRAEVCDFILDPDSKVLRQLLRDSVTRGGKTYSTWIRHLSSENFPCDEFGIYLLAYTYKRHVIVVLSDRLWCTFKTGRMNTFEKICKSDHVLLWLGDDKYSEVKLLQVRENTGNIADWKRLAESIDIVHERNQKAKYNRRVSRATASIKTPTKKPVSPPAVRAPSRRERGISIDYKQLHNDGTYEEKRRKVVKFPPQVHGPSDSRIASQNLISSRKKSPVAASLQKRGSPKTDLPSGYLPRRTVNVTQRAIKQELRTCEPTKIVKPEPGIFMRHRERPGDKERQWKYVHISGRRCRQGGALDCNSQSENDEDDHTLPDLVKPRACTGILPTSIRDNTNSDAHLMSPPAVERRLFMQNNPKDVRERNLGDLLCTLNFDRFTPDSNLPPSKTSSTVPCVLTTTNTTDVRKVVTDDPAVKTVSTAQSVVTISSDDSTPPHRNKVHLESNEAVQTAQTPLSDTRSVVTPRQDQAINVADVDSYATPTLASTPDTRSVVTPHTARAFNVANIDLNATPASIPSILSTPPPVTQQDAASVNPPQCRTQTPTMTPPTPATLLMHSATLTPRSVVTRPDVTEVGSNTTHASPTITPPSPLMLTGTTTPRSVVTNPDSTEMETANLLLQLSNSQSSLDSIGDNADILPVDAERMDDFTLELRKKEDASAQETVINQQTNEPKTSKDSDTDSEKTVIYDTQDSSLVKEIGSPKGQLRYKHYGITRKSPSNAPRRNYYCCYCETTCHSKQEFNRHHKEEHTIVKCPDCPRTFPTPDALQRHRYVHNTAHQFKCNFCNKTCGFKSDLDLHMLKHVESKRWYCEADGCDKDFKRKSDLTSHEKVHLGEFFICEYPGCKYKNRDPRLVKRHQRVHTQEARVRCKKCSRKFVFYQQMKRHMKMDHVE